MNAETVSTLNFLVHSLVIGAAAWLLVRFVIRDALRRCILANLAVLMCLYSPFNISMQDLLPPPKEVPVWTPIRETFKADWRVSVAPARGTEINIMAEKRGWDVNEVVKVLRRISWCVTALLLVRLLLQSVRVQLWAWRLREPTQEEMDVLPRDAPFERLSVFEGEGTPCVAGWFFPVLAVPAGAFQKLTERQWGWLLRHEMEHLRLHDTVAALLQNSVRAFLWWNPFTHALMEEYARAREEMCDAAAVGEEREHRAYADFLLAWAARPGTQHACVMPIAYSRPAKRLKVRLVALMEARGFRKRVSALFVLGCLAFAMVAPWITASFGIATVTAQEAAKTVSDDGALNTRVYIVAPDFLSWEVGAKDPFATPKAETPVATRRTARELLEQGGVPFPPGASAIYRPATSQLIVRNTSSNIRMTEQIIDRHHTMAAMVHITCKLIQTDEFLGVNESLLSPQEMETLVRSMSQKRGVDLLSSPAVTTKFDQSAIIEVGREVLPKLLPDGKLSGDVKFFGLSIEFVAKGPVQGKSTVEAKVNLGLDPESDLPWLPQKEKAVDWDKVQIHTVTAKKALASGETLLLHLPTSKRPVTVLITATALKSDGSNAASFEATTLRAPPASQGRDLPKETKRQEEWAVREYRVPANFGDGKPPVEYLEACGVIFPQGAKAELVKEKLTVRNTQGNLDLIEALVESHLAAGRKNDKQVHLVVLVMDVKKDADGLMTLIFPEMKKEPGKELSLMHQFTLQGVMTDAQFQVALRNLTNGGNNPVSLPNATVKSGKEAVFDMPADVGGPQLKVTPAIGADGHTVDVSIQAASLDPATKRIITTGVTIWNGQTVMMAGRPAGEEKKMRVIFITAALIAPLGDPVKK